MNFLGYRKYFLTIIPTLLLLSLLIFYLKPQRVHEEKLQGEDYIEAQINSFLQNNPGASRSYARDVVYRDLARKEKNPEICELIKNEEIKISCYNAVK